MTIIAGQSTARRPWRILRIDSRTEKGLPPASVVRNAIFAGLESGGTGPSRYSVVQRLFFRSSFVRGMTTQS